MKIDADVERIVRSAPADQNHVFVLEWDTMPPDIDLSSLVSRAEKRAALQSAAKSAKEPLLSTLRQSDSIDLNEMGGGSHAVVAATTAVWRQLLEEPVLQDAQGRVMPNASFDAD